MVVLAELSPDARRWILNIPFYTGLKNVSRYMQTCSPIVFVLKKKTEINYIE